MVSQQGKSYFFLGRNKIGQFVLSIGTGVGVVIVE
jgi:hypothetical protein